MNPGPELILDRRTSSSLAAFLRSSFVQYALYALMFSIWGSSFFFTAIALRSFNPVVLPLVRMAIATVALAGVVVVRRLPFPRGGVIYGHFAVLGILNIAFPYLLLTWAQRHVNSSSVSVLSATTPLFVFLFSWLVTGSERFNLLRGMGVVLAFLGVTSLCGPLGSASPGISVWSLVIVFCSMIFAIGNIYTRWSLVAVHPFMIAFLQVGAGTAYLLVANLVAGSLHVERPAAASILAILELGVLGSALTYLLFFHFIQRWGSTAASLNTYFQPVIGLGLGVAVLGEGITIRSWVSLIIILLGVLSFGAGTMLVTILRSRSGSSL